MAYLRVGLFLVQNEILKSCLSRPTSRGANPHRAASELLHFGTLWQFFGGGDVMVMGAGNWVEWTTDKRLISTFHINSKSGVLPATAILTGTHRIRFTITSHQDFPWRHNTPR